MPLVPLESFQVDSKRENMGKSTKFKENIKKESFKSLSSMREDMNESKSPECQECVPSHSRWTARGRTWGIPPSSSRTLKKKVLRV